MTLTSEEIAEVRYALEEEYGPETDVVLMADSGLGIVVWAVDGTEHARHPFESLVPVMGEFYIVRLDGALLLQEI